MASTFTSRTGTHPEEGIKAPVVTATTAAITLSGEQTINTVVVTAGDRVLVKDQADSAENGIYIAATGAWSRAPDWNDAQDVLSGVTVVDDGNDEVWKAEFIGTFQAGTTEVTFDNVFTPGSLADSAVTTAKINDRAVTVTKMARATATYILLGQGAGNDLAWKQVTGDISIGASGVVTLSNSSVTTSKISTNAVTMTKLEKLTSGHLIIGQGAGNTASKAMSGDGTIDANGVFTIGNAKVTTVKLASDAVETAKIKDQAVTEQKLSPAVQGKLNTTGANIYDLKAGLKLSNNTTDSDHDIDVAAGSCSDSTDSVIMTLSAGATSQIDVTIGTGNGGFPSSLTSGAVQNDTWYRVFIVAEADGSNPKVCFDTSSTAANALNDATAEFSGTYTIYRRIGWVLTDGSANITAFHQYGNRFVWDVLVRDGAVSSATSRTAQSVTAPNGSMVSISVHMETQGSSGEFCIITSDDQDDTVPSSSLYTIRTNASGGDATKRDGFVEYEIYNASGSINYRCTGTGENLYFHTRGWVDLFED